MKMQTAFRFIFISSNNISTLNLQQILFQIATAFFYFFSYPLSRENAADNEQRARLVHQIWGTLRESFVNEIERGYFQMNIINASALFETFLN